MIIHFLNVIFILFMLARLPHAHSDTAFRPRPRLARGANKKKKDENKSLCVEKIWLGEEEGVSCVCACELQCIVITTLIPRRMLMYLRMRDGFQWHTDDDDDGSSSCREISVWKRRGLINVFLVLHEPLFRMSHESRAPESEKYREKERERGKDKK
jgi:hypothetical protein